MGLCREQANDPDAASKCHERAAALSQTFAMPCLRLGMLARRAGDHERARHMLTRALQTFPSQTERQRLLYCGGFSSEALVALCRSELSACEVTP
jgi:chemotaxis protein methyltransferase CheR